MHPHSFSHLNASLTSPDPSLAPSNTPLPSQALRDVDTVHEAWAHRVSEERRAQAAAEADQPVPQFCDISVLGRTRVVSRLLFMLIMALCVTLFHLHMVSSRNGELQLEVEGEAGVCLASLAGQLI